LLSKSLWAQCPTPGFSLPDTVCVGQNITVTNTSSGATHYEWDFCSGDLQTMPMAKSVGTITNGNITVRNTIAFDGTNYFGFITSRNTNELYRLDFGNAVTNTPVINKLAITDSQLNNPDGIRFYKEGLRWYAIISNLNGSLVRYDFGTSLTNIPAPSDIKVLNVPDGLLNTPVNLVVVKENGAVIVCVANNGSGQISILNFGNSITNNTITGSNFSIPGISNLYDFTVAKDCDRWYGLAAGLSSNALYKVDFGSSLMNVSPVVTSIASVNSPFAIEMLSDKSRFYAMVGTNAGNLIRLSFGASLANTPVTRDLGNLGTLGTISGLSFVKQLDSKWVGLGINYDSRALYQITFPSVCSTNVPIAKIANPSNVSYSQLGTYSIDLVAIDADGNRQSITDSVVVVGPPDPSFATQKQCVGDNTEFKGVASGIISKWKWDFGDPANPTATSSLQNPLYQYPQAGIYTVIMTIEDKRGCTSSVTKQVKISANPPQAAFVYVNQLCPDNTIQFTDRSSPFGNETITEWDWDFGDPTSNNNSSTVASPSHTYASQGTYSVTLKVTSSSGCDATMTQQVIVTTVRLSFALPDTICTNENIQVNNMSSSEGRYEWDFCTGDLSNSFSIGKAAEITNGNITIGITTVFDGNNYFGFATSRENNQLYRLDFGEKLTNTPFVYLLPLASSQLNGPEGIKFYREGENWYALIVNINNSSLVRYRFGDKLTNIPSVADITTLAIPAGLLNIPRNLAIIKNLGNLFVIIANTGNNQVSILNFGNSIANNTLICRNLNVPGSNGIIGIDLVNDCGEWYAMCVGNASGTVHIIEFGSDLQNPASKVSTLGEIFSGPIAVEWIKDQGKYYAYISVNGQIIKYSFGLSPANKTPVVSSQGTSLNYTGLSFIKQKDSKWFGLGIEYIRRTISRFEFPSNCSASQPLSDFILPVVNYSQPGNYYVTMTAYDANGNSRTLTDSVVVKNTVAPTVNFTTDDQCTQLATKFFGPTPDVDSWQWDFGDTNLPANSPDNVSSEQNPMHQYTKEGTYQVSLIVNSSNGCSNRTMKAITIYNNQKPTPAFSFPAQVCSFGEMPFIDQSIPATGDVVRKWRWDFGDGQSSTEQNPVHIYKQGGDFQVMLSVSGISGCDSSLTKTVKVIPGADVDFSYARVCIGDTLTFTNLTAPDGEWQWDFGDFGSTDNESTLKNPKHYYTASGDYTVRLSTKTANGCVVTRQKEVKVRTLPTVEFINSQLCGNSPVTFTISAASADTTVASFAWNFGDPNSPDNTSTEESPTHTFTTGGTYTVMLKLTTSAGCQGTASRTLTVADPSRPNFTVLSACTGSPLSFNDTSIPATGDPIIRWSWDFGDQTPVIRVRNPVHTYANPGFYTVKLTIEGGNSSCGNSVSKTVTVFPQPQVNFSTEFSCDNYAVKFTDRSAVNNDRIRSWEWNFGAEGTSNEANPTFLFNRTGTFAVTLKVTTDNGCSTSIVKIITVDPLPEADFRFSPNFAVPPVEVAFANDSRRALRYEWDFGDNSPLSNEVAPRHTYSAIGSYNVRLLAFGGSGCADTLVKMVNVTVRLVDAQVKNATVTNANGIYTAFAEIYNAGTVPLQSMELVWQSGMAVDVVEKWVGTLNPKQVLIYPFKAQLQRRDASGFTYFCIRAEKPNDTIDSYPDDNRFCISPRDEFTVLPIHPNPANAAITLTYLLPEASPVNIRIVSVQGKQVLTYQETTIWKRYNEQKMDISNLAAGLYLIQVMYQGQVKSQRFIKLN
jgi:PKD repeat protein